MKTKVTINGVEYNLDLKKAKELGILEKEDTRCKSWEKFREKYKNKQGFCYDDVYRIIETIEKPIITNEQLTETEAIAIIAFSKLLKLRRDWIGDWNPDWYNSENKYCISVCETHIKVNSFCAIQQTFSFPTREMAEEFLKCFKDLFVQCKCLI